MAKRRAKNPWPMKGTMIGVHPSQVKDAQATLKALDSPGEFDPKTGNLKLKSQKEYAEWCRKTGRMNLDAGYGDHAGGDRPPTEIVRDIRERLEWARRKKA